MHSLFTPAPTSLSMYIYTSVKYTCTPQITLLISWWGVFDTTICDSLSGTPVSSTNKTDRPYLSEILLNVALNTINLNHPTVYCMWVYLYPIRVFELWLYCICKCAIGRHTFPLSLHDISFRLIILCLHNNTPMWVKQIQIQTNKT